MVADVGEPPGALDDAVEEVAVRDPQPLAVGGDVQPLVDDVDAAEVVADVAARELVVVAGNEDHARALARLAQQLLDDVVVRLRPVPAAAQLPAVDDVADEVERLALGAAQEVEQRVRLAAGRAQVQVRDPEAAEAPIRQRCRGRAGAGVVVVADVRAGCRRGPGAQERGVSLHARQGRVAS